MTLAASPWFSVFTGELNEREWSGRRENPQNRKTRRSRETVAYTKSDDHAGKLLSGVLDPRERRQRETQYPGIFLCSRTKMYVTLFTDARKWPFIVI